MAAFTLPEPFGMVDRAEVGVSPLAVHEAVFPLYHHAQMLIVEQQDLDWQFLAGQRRQLLHVHQHAAVAIDVDADAVRVGGLHPHGCGQAEAHRAQAGAGEPAFWLAELEVLSGPHLMLTHTHGDQRILVDRLLPELRDGSLRQDVFRVVLERQRILVPPFVDLLPPVIDLWLVGFGEAIANLGEKLLHVAHDGDVSFLVLVHLRWIDVDMDDLAVLGELIELAGHTIIEPHTQGDQQISLVDGEVRICRAVHAEHVQRLRIVAGEGSDTHHGCGDGNPRQASELGELVSCVRVNDTAADVEDGLLGAANGCQNAIDRFLRNRLRLGFVPRKVHFGIPVDVPFELGQQNVLREVNQNRPGTS